MRLSPTWATRIALPIVVVLILVGGLIFGLGHLEGKRPGTPRLTGTASPARTRPTPSPEPHVLIIVEENQGYNSTQVDCGVDNSYFCLLASEYASIVPWYGVTHPSLPNYLALTSGSTQGCLSDGCPGPYAVDNLGHQLTQAGIPWAAYMESMPTPCYRGLSLGEYAKKHDPFSFYSDLLDKGACAQHVLPYPGVSHLLSALDATGSPDYVWITPNLLDDMHDGTLAQGNAWLQANLGPVLSSPWFTRFQSTVIVTDDENDDQPTGSCCDDAAGGQIPELVISRKARGRAAISITGDQYGTLRSIEETFRLPLLGAAAEASNGDLLSLFG
ncbi:MAG TPA: alkaline phosphatase family protein [Candidatus Dormibacteraeota bacterium]|nr:alkaline phosphatase family protein [Candidatus Dormibacteraeota bacterium]